MPLRKSEPARYTPAPARVRQTGSHPPKPLPCEDRALTTEPNNPEIAPGWHTVDISFGTCGTGCGAIDVWYDGVLYGTVSGKNVLDGGSQDDPYWITYSTGSCNSGSNGDVCNAGNGGQTGGTVTIAWLRIFT